MDEGSWDVNRQVLMLENIPYSSSFHKTWSAFTSLPLMNLNTVAGKKVCLKEAMFPDWAEVFELFNCDDPACYMDLARMRGVGYNTHDWGDKMTMVEVQGGYTGPAHKKFVNYEFDSDEFLRVMNAIREKVIEKELFRKQQYDVTHEEL